MGNGKPKTAQMSDSLSVAVFLILSGGFQDAYTYFCRDGVFANAQTGNIVLMSTSLFRGEWLRCLKYLVPLTAFFLGVIVAEQIRRRFSAAEALHWRQITVACEIVILFAVGFLPEVLTPFANAAISFVCAMQVQTFSTVEGNVYASTMCIGNIRNGTVALNEYLHTREKKHLRTALTYFAIILLFAIGAGIGSLMTAMLGYRAIWCSCILLLVSFFMMFKKPLA